MDIRELYETYFSTVYKYIFSISRDVHIAEDVTQETFFKALKYADGFRGDCKLSVWLIQIAKNCYMDELRKRKRILSAEEIEGTVSPDQKTEFLVEVETCNVRREYPAEEIPANRLVMDFGAISSGEGDTEMTIPTLEKVYYLPKEYVDFFFSDDPEEAKKELKELEEKSVLLWVKNANDRGETTEEGSFAVSTDPVRYYNGKTEIRTETGSWTIPVGSYADKNGYVYDASGTCIGVNETYRYVYDPDALG